MPQKLTDSLVKKHPTPKRGNRVHYDTEVKGFGVRVTAAGSRAFVLNYRTRGGRERRYTIGSFPDWKTTAARTEAAEIKKQIDRGEDPLTVLEQGRQAKTVADLCDRFGEEVLPRRRPSTQRDYGRIIAKDIRPAFKHRKVQDISFADIDELHRKITKRGASYVANRAVALLSKMFNCAIRWQWRTDNPCKGVERNAEQRRQRYLSSEELGRLTSALAKHSDTQAANIIRLLLFTGARSGEVCAARWEQFDLRNGVWTKPAATTKQKRFHRVPLSAPARQLLIEIRAGAEPTPNETQRGVSEWIFPGNGKTGHRTELKKSWRGLCEAAGIVTMKTVKGRDREHTVLKPSARIHDLRHTYASLLASAGLSLPIIGALLGHTQAQTTQRYAHLLDDPLRAATERVGALVSGKPTAEIIPMKGAG